MSHARRDGLVHIPELTGLSKEEGAAFRWDPVSKIITPLGQFANGSLEADSLTPGTAGQLLATFGGAAVWASPLAFQELISNSAEVAVTTDAATEIDSVTLTLPAGWSSMDVLLTGGCGHSEASASDVRMDVWLESPSGTEVGQRGSVSKAAAGANLTAHASLTALLVSLTANQVVRIVAQRTLSTGPQGIRRRYLVAFKVRKT